MIPLWVKITYTLFAATTIVVYAFKYPLGNFLWFSDIALVLTMPALWFESNLLASTIALGTLLPEVFWNVGFFGRLLTGKRLAGLTDYMFDEQKPRYLRALSLFHVFLPVLLLWMIARLGYSPKALIAMTVLAWIVLPLTYVLTDPDKNINWVFGPASVQRSRLHSILYLGMLMIAFPVIVYFPTHLLLMVLFP
jgi:hypothetical protein